MADTASLIARLTEALETAIKVAEEARVEWDNDPSGMKAGKLLIALSDPSGMKAGKLLIALSDPSGMKAGKLLIALSDPSGMKAGKLLIALSDPSGMKAGKLLIALSDPRVKYRADITEMHEARASLKSRSPS